MRRRFAVCLPATLLAAAVLSVTWRASSSRLQNFPCPGCFVDVPAASVGDAAAPTKRPLLVLLHGDDQSPTAAAGPWQKEADRRGIVLLALKCPVAKGCPGSWWKWSGDPKWIDAQVDAVAAKHEIDDERVWLSGWSGGASYIGLFAARLSSRYAALSMNGGGLSASPDPCPACTPPVYFLVGDKNPLHHLAQASRAWFDGCVVAGTAGAGIDVVWDLVPGADHGGEALALAKPAKMATIFDWLEKHPRRTCAFGHDAGPPDVSADVSADGPADAAVVDAPSSAASDHGRTLEPNTPSLPAGGRCGCRTAGASHEGSAAAATVVAMLSALAMLWRRGLSRAPRSGTMAPWPVCGRCASTSAARD